MKTKGALLWGPRQPWTVEEIEIGDPREGEVKIRLEAVGTCHSDYHLVTGATPWSFQFSPATRVPGKLNLADMVTRQYTREQINEGFQDMLEGKIIRGVIRYTDDDRR
jgi:Zn-dependent alcohol dehydrogenase